MFSGDVSAIGASEYDGVGDGGGGADDDDARGGRFPRERRRVGDDNDDGRGGSDLHSSVRLAEIGAALDSQVSHYRAECHELRISRDALLRTNAALHARVEADARLAAELDEERGMRTAAERALAVARAQIDAQTSLARELQSANNALEGTKEELSTLASTVAAERDQLHADLTSAREDVARLSSQLDAQTADATGNASPLFLVLSHKRGWSTVVVFVAVTRARSVEVCVVRVTLHLVGVSLVVLSMLNRHVSIASDSDLL